MEICTKRNIRLARNETFDKNQDFVVDQVLFFNPNVRLWTCWLLTAQNLETATYLIIRSTAANIDTATKARATTSPTQAILQPGKCGSTIFPHSLFEPYALKFSRVLQKVTANSLASISSQFFSPQKGYFGPTSHGPAGSPLPADEILQ